MPSEFEIWLCETFASYEVYMSRVEAVQRISLGPYDHSPECVLLPYSRLPSCAPHPWVIVYVPEDYREYRDSSLEYLGLETEEECNKEWDRILEAQMVIDSITSEMTSVISESELENLRETLQSELDYHIKILS